MKTFTKKLSERKPLRELVPLDFPLGICIEPTNRCNFFCSFCPVSRKDFKKIVGSRGDMSLEVFSKLISDISPYSQDIKRINLYGDGEPLLNKNLERFIDELKATGTEAPITVTTNASLLSRDRSKKLCKTGLDYLRCSIYGASEESFRSLTGMSISYSTIVENIKEFRNIRVSNSPFLYVKKIASYDAQDELFRETFSAIADEINLETPMNWNGVAGNLISFLDPSQKTDQKQLQGYFKDCSSIPNKRICTVPFHSLNIKANGDVTICIVDWNKGTKVGNIMESSLYEIWHGEALREFRRMHIEGRRAENISCRNCSFLYGNPDSVDDIDPQILLG